MWALDIVPASVPATLKSFCANTVIAPANKTTVQPMLKQVAFLNFMIATILSCMAFFPNPFEINDQ